LFNYEQLLLNDDDDVMLGSVQQASYEKSFANQNKDGAPNQN
jgi:hypothetical protein